MSAMTEARLNLIADDISICGANVALHHSKELISEVRRLRECIAKAPHSTGYALTDAQNMRNWKREALGGGE